MLSGSSPSPPLAAPPCLAPSSMTFDYLYEFSETRKVLEEFFKCPKSNDIDHDTGTLDDINEFQVRHFIVLLYFNFIYDIVFPGLRL